MRQKESESTSKMDKKFIIKIWPGFFTHKHSILLDSFYTFTNYWKVWMVCIGILAVASLTPLFLATSIHYKLIHKSVDSELMLRAERLTSSVKRSISFFINERLDALTFIAKDTGFEDLSDNRRLNRTFNNLKLGVGGYTDLSVIDQDGRQIAYAGPFNLEGKNYRNQPWFTQSLKNTNFISEVITGYRNAPHIIIAVKAEKEDGSDFILRATLDIERLIWMIQQYTNDIHTDIFLINQKGILQTPSSNFGNIFNKAPVKIPRLESEIKIISDNQANKEKKTIITGYSYIYTDKVRTPFILIVRNVKEGVMSNWLKMRKAFNWFIGISSLLIIAIITFLSTFMVNKLYVADKTRAQTMFHMEQSQQLASIGQLAAGVAHEINNPLAQINETAGYIKDMYQFDAEKINPEEMMEYLDDVLDAVERCGSITRQLLGFVRQFDIRIREVDLGKMIRSVLDFHKKESEYRNIGIATSFPEGSVFIETDSGKLQQILVNLINNAFQALEDDGCLDISVSQSEAQEVVIVIKDTGCGIPEEHINRIQEPFFSTKTEKTGTGLGLSITYGLVKKLQGRINVESVFGVGTVFTITLPLKIQQEDHE